MNQNNSAIERFTYDWCIRFVRLTPSDEDQSKLSDVSPYFTGLVNKYSRFERYDSIFIDYLTKVEKAFSTNKEIVIFENLKFWHTMPRCISIVSKRKIYTPKIELVRCNLTPNELLYAVANARNELFVLRGVLTEPVNYSSILPYLSHLEKITLDLQGLVYDDSVPMTVARAKDQKRLKGLHLYNFELHKGLTLKLIDNALKSLEVDMFADYRIDLWYSPPPPDERLKPIIEAIPKMFKAAGVPSKHFLVYRSKDSFKISMKISYERFRLSEGRTYVNTPHNGCIQITGFDVPQRTWYDRNGVIC